MLSEVVFALYQDPLWLDDVFYVFTHKTIRRGDTNWNMTKDLEKMGHVECYIYKNESSIISSNTLVLSIKCIWRD